MSIGWSLEDAEARAAASPDTFIIAPPETRAGLEPGEHAKLIFVFDSGGVEQVERMWTVVVDNEGGRYAGLLANTPFESPDDPALRHGAEIRFEARHVIDWEYADDDSRAMLAAFRTDG